MDALDLLEQQHRDVCQVFEQIEAEASAGHRTALVLRLVRMIDAHTRAEERHLYVACFESDAQRAFAYEGCELHALARHAATNLLRTRATDVRFAARLKLLRQMFDRHADLEDARLFQHAKRSMTDEQLDSLGELLRKSFDLLMDTTPYPPASARKLRARRRGGARPRTRASAVRGGATASARA